MKNILNRKFLVYLVIVGCLLVFGIRHVVRYVAGPGELSAVINNLISENDFEGCNKIISFDLSHDGPADYQCVTAFAVHNRDVTLCNKGSNLSTLGYDRDCIGVYIDKTKDNVDCDSLFNQYNHYYKDMCFYHIATAIESQTLDKSIACKKMTEKLGQDDCEKAFGYYRDIASHKSSHK